MHLEKKKTFFSVDVTGNSFSNGKKKYSFEITLKLKKGAAKNQLYSRLLRILSHLGILIVQKYGTALCPPPLHYTSTWCFSMQIRMYDLKEILRINLRLCFGLSLANA